MRIINEGKLVDIGQCALAGKAVLRDNALYIAERTFIFPILLQQFNKRLLTFTDHDTGKLWKFCHQLFGMKRDLRPAKPKLRIREYFGKLGK